VKKIKISKFRHLLPKTGIPVMNQYRISGMHLFYVAAMAVCLFQKTWRLNYRCINDLNKAVDSIRIGGKVQKNQKI
jgi:hypothetical protein